MSQRSVFTDLKYQVKKKKKPNNNNLYKANIPERVVAHICLLFSKSSSALCAPLRTLTSACGFVVL